MAGLRIAVFFDAYQPFHEIKDPGQLVGGLRDLGVDAFLVTYPKPGIDALGDGAVTTVLPQETENPGFWRGLQVSAVILYSWLSPRYLRIQEGLRAAGVSVILKADTDGRLSFPLLPRRISAPPERASSLPRWITLHLKARIGAPHRLRALARVLEATDVAIVESPAAASNVAFLLRLHGRQDLISKIRELPNPVHPRFVEAPLGQKQNLVIAVARWDDVSQKNTRAMVQGLVEFLSVRPDYRAIIVGSGENLIFSLLRKYRLAGERVTVLGPITHADLPKLLDTAKIFLLPSRWEGFPVAACEALCMGCSLVVTPLEGFAYLTAGGTFGSLTVSFNSVAVAAALVYEAHRWDAAYHSGDAIARYWRARLDRRAVARRLLKIVEGLATDETRI